VILIGIFIALILLHSLVSKRLDRTILTAPIVFAGAGMLVLPALRVFASSKAISKCL